MKMFELRKESGFSLVELMIVVAIIAILAAIAIPAFMQFAMKAKTSEASGNLSAIRTCEESYRAENDVYLTAAATPVPGGNDCNPDKWQAGGITWFSKMGFEPDGNVRYSYLIESGTGGEAAPGGGTNEIIGAFKITAQSDLDEDETPGTFIVDSGADDYPKPFWNDEY